MSAKQRGAVALAKPSEVCILWAPTKQVAAVDRSQDYNPSAAVCCRHLL